MRSLPRGERGPEEMGALPRGERGPEEMGALPRGEGYAKVSAGERGEPQKDGGDGAPMA